MASGKVPGRCFQRHTHVESIAFLESLAKRYPKRELHLICDNYGTHKHPAVLEWRAAHPRCHWHFTPISASWLNLVERWFALITSQAIRRASFDSVRRLERTITRYLADWNDNAKPFRWIKTAAQSNAVSIMLNLFTVLNTRELGQAPYQQPAVATLAAESIRCE